MSDELTWMIKVNLSCSFIYAEKSVTYEMHSCLLVKAKETCAILMLELFLVKFVL